MPDIDHVQRGSKQLQCRTVSKNTDANGFFLINAVTRAPRLVYISACRFIKDIIVYEQFCYRIH